MRFFPNILTTYEKDLKSIEHRYGNPHHPGENEAVQFLLGKLG
jgi:hypothetical protein